MGALATPVALAVAACARREPTNPAMPATVVIENFSAAGKSLGKASVPRVVKTDEEWRSSCPPDSFT